MHINIGRILKKNGVKNLEDITLEKDIEDSKEKIEDQEEFYKIGRTYKKVKYRFSGKITMPYKFNIIYEIKGDAEIIFKEEQRLKDLHKEFRYTPKLKFHGMYECYNKIIK